MSVMVVPGVSTQLASSFLLLWQTRPVQNFASASGVGVWGVILMDAVESSQPPSIRGLQPEMGALLGK